MTLHLVKQLIAKAITSFSRSLPPVPPVPYFFIPLSNAGSPYSNAAVAAGAVVYFSLDNPPGYTPLNEEDFVLVNAFAGLPVGIDIQASVVTDSVDVMLINRTASPVAVTNLVVNALIFKKKI